MDIPGRRHGGRGTLETRLLRHGRGGCRGGSQEWESGELGGVGMVGDEEERGEARGPVELGRARRGFETRDYKWWKRLEPVGGKGQLNGASLAFGRAQLLISLRYNIKYILRPRLILRKKKLFYNK